MASAVGADHLHVELLEYAHCLSDSAVLSAVCPPMVGKQRVRAARFSMILATISGVIGSI